MFARLLRSAKSLRRALIFSRVVSLAAPSGAAILPDGCSRVCRVAEQPDNISTNSKKEQNNNLPEDEYCIRNIGKFKVSRL
jgi:hypothetical protein